MSGKRETNGISQRKNFSCRLWNEGKRERELGFFPFFYSLSLEKKSLGETSYNLSTYKCTDCRVPCMEEFDSDKELNLNSDLVAPKITCYLFASASESFFLWQSSCWNYPAATWCPPFLGEIVLILQPCQFLFFSMQPFCSIQWTTKCDLFAPFASDSFHFQQFTIFITYKSSWWCKWNIKISCWKIIR